MKVCLTTDYHFLTNLFDTPLAEAVWDLLSTIPTPAYVIAV